MIFRKTAAHFSGACSSFQKTTRRMGRGAANAPKGKATWKGNLVGLPVFSLGRLGQRCLEAIQDLVGPEPLEAIQRLVQRRELLVRDAADLLDRLDVLLIERIDDAADLLTLRGQGNADRAAINARALMIEEAELDELLQIVGDVGAEIVAARAQLARGQLLVADVVEQERLHRVDVGAASAIEFVLDDVEQ